MGLKELSIKIGFDRVQYKAKDRQILRFSLINDSNETIYLLKWNTPFDGFNSDMFLVLTDSTKSVYMGRIVKRGAPQPEDYIAISPKDSTSVNVDLSEAYDIHKSGSYSVEFKSWILDAGTEKPDVRVRARKMAIRPELTPISVSSNIASFELLESRSPRQLNGIVLEMVEKIQRGVRRLAPNFNNCSADRQKTLNIALTEAVRISQEAYTSLSSTREALRRGAIRYITWFGIFDYQRYDKVTDNFEKILDALDNKVITFNCDCDEDEASVIAYTYPTKPYEIYLCKLYWSEPLTGDLSQSSVIVHETSHFNVVAGTNDHVYGYQGCKDLAINNPSDAIDNADNYEYFAVNSDSLPMDADTKIMGKVINGSTGQPIDGALVEARGGSPDSVYTNTLGDYIIDVLPDYYDLRASVSGLGESEIGIRVAPGETFRQDFSLDNPLGIVIGSVINAVNRKPIINASVSVVNHLEISCKTDSLGNFSLSAPSGIQELVVVATGYVLNTKSVTVIANGTITANLEMKRQPPCTEGIPSHCLEGRPDQPPCPEGKPESPCPGARPYIE